MIWDWLIVGSGFGGSVSALRLAEKGYSVLVLEKGRRWRPEEFPRSNWNLPHWLWVPALGFRGILKMSFFRHFTGLSGVGVGGGSLVYAATLPTPRPTFFRAPGWGHLADWEKELAPHYETARRMLGARENPTSTASDRVLARVADSLGRVSSFHPASVGVYFGRPGEVAADPYFDGQGPDRTGCIICGGCMTGCRHGAKNSLDLNYLWLAQARGAKVLPETEVSWIRPLEDGSGYQVTARGSRSFLRRRTLSFQARNVILAGGVLGTVELLLRLKSREDGLPRLSEEVGNRVRTNSEALIGVTTRRRDLDMSEGVAITSIFHPDERSSLEPVRFASGSGFFRLLSTPHAPGATALRRALASGGRVLRHPVHALRVLLVWNWAKRTAVLMYMRVQEGHLRLGLRRRLRSFFRPGLVTARGDGPSPTAAIPEATDLAERFAREVDGFLGSLLTETLFGIPTTAHILGGATMGEDADEGVIDHRHRVFGYPGLFVVDGSAVSANPGVNPSLTIAALAERAMTFIPPREGGGEPVRALGAPGDSSGSGGSA